MGIVFKAGKVIEAIGPLTEECRATKRAYECTEPAADLRTFTLGGLVLDDENQWHLHGVRAAAELKPFAPYSSRDRPNREAAEIADI